MDFNTQKFLQRIQHPVKFRLLLFSRLPAAFFSGLSINEVNENRCSISVPFMWFTQNPFKSTYFASLAMAAEMSTGMLAMMHVYKREPRVSMLITSMRANYFKKAISKVIFICEEGNKIHDIIQESISTNKPATITVKSTGKNKKDELIAEFFFTWSFKTKQG